ncbi:type II toxin-antitoxin system RelE/ParE family toxin [Variovorax sp. J22R133]|uniref:type II toxin-antitoxin system RelE/ParE family toxin n=1 Tax=Variovorax brevis TaxID=3053503 RepID=UPI00257767EA|nr:type II toxin-antitoxin system RelE/ParE family toxin [Variovorax sp. J22R133]MDM0116853.1 type II toxin-antitoxin system RelE/ParE family toxin [Variovorax sp. J22R133]
MTRIELVPEVLGDFDRFVEHMERFEVPDAAARVGEILQAIDILVHSPMIGRPVKGGKRELLIGRDSRAYVALYRYVPEIDIVFVLALRSQREADFKR